jgi:hypothetical protein
MDIHKPKPWHGAREFLKEYLIIVVGVLTALSAEAGVEWLHWRHEVEVADAGLRKELRLDGTFAFQAMAAWPCEQRRLDELSAALRRTHGVWKGHSTEDRPGRKASFVTPGHPWPEVSWDEYRRNGAVQHMSDARRWQFNSAYVDVLGERTWGTELGQASAELAILADDLPLSEVTRDRELAAIEHARSAGYMAAFVGKLLVDVLGQMDITFTEAERHPSVAACRAQYGPGRPIGG